MLHELHETWSQRVLRPQSPATWLWHGIIAPGRITLLTGLPQVGKTRLLCTLLGHRAQGKPLLDLPLQPGKTFLVSDENTGLWLCRFRMAKLDIDDTVCFCSRPFTRVPTLEQFEALRTRIITFAQAHGIDLVIFDDWRRFAGEAGVRGPDSPLPSGGEGLGGHAMGALRPFTEAGLAVLLIDRPGEDACESLADIHVELTRLSRTNRSIGRRRLTAQRGYTETPSEVRFAMDATWASARLLPARAPRRSRCHGTTLRTILEQSHDMLTRQEIFTRWPTDPKRPNPATLWRWLESAWANGDLHREGAGTPQEPFRYGPAGASTNHA